MSSQKLRALLFDAIPPSDIPLFRNASDLAEEIAKLEETKYFGKAPSVVALISQCLRGQRSFPEPFKQALRMSFRIRAASFQLQDIEALSEEITNILESPISEKSKSDQLYQKPSRDPYDAFINDASDANDFLFLVSHGTGQLDFPKSKIHGLANILIEKLNLYKNADPVSHSESVFRFYLPDSVAADWLWWNLFKKMITNNLKGEMDSSEAIDRMHALINLGKMEVNIVNEPAICALPLLMLDCEFKARGYSFFFNEDGDARIFKWNAKNVYMFYTLFYRRRAQIECIRHIFNADDIRNRFRS